MRVNFDELDECETGSMLPFAFDEGEDFLDEERELGRDWLEVFGW